MTQIDTDSGSLRIELSGAQVDVVTSEKEDGTLRASTYVAVPTGEFLDALDTEFKVVVIAREDLPPITQDDLDDNVETYDYLMTQAKSFLALAEGVRTRETGRIFATIAEILPEANEFEVQHLAEELFKRGMRVEG